MDTNIAAALTEIKFLEGLQSRWKEFKFTVEVLFDFIKGFWQLG